MKDRLEEFREYLEGLDMGEESIKRDMALVKVYIAFRMHLDITEGGIHGK